MSIKRKVKYSVPYNKDTDTLSEKLNVLLNNIVNLIKTNNPELKETSRITYGSEQMTGEPLYSGKGNIDVKTRLYQSDLVFLGIDKNNIVLSIGFYDSRLVIAMNVDPYVEGLYLDNWDTLKYNSYTVRSFAVGKASRWRSDVNHNRYNINIPYIVVKDEIRLDIVYWKGTNSNGYAFYNAKKSTNDVDLVFYKTEEPQSLGCALWKYSGDTSSYNNKNPSQILTWSFNESLTDNMISDHKLSCSTYDSSSNTVKVAPSSTVESNSKYDMREWFLTSSDSNSYYNDNNVNFYAWTGANMADFHTLGVVDGSSAYDSAMPVYDTVETSTTDYSTNDSYHISALCSAYNLPYLNNDNEIYLRQVRIPGFIKNCTGELYLMWTPAKESYKSGDIIEVDGDNYAVINKGVVCWVVKV